MTYIAHVVTVSLLRRPVFVVDPLTKVPTYRDVTTNEVAHVFRIRILDLELQEIQ
jgi:hypothetical protein